MMKRKLAWICFCAISAGLFCNNVLTVVPNTAAERTAHVMAYILPALFIVFFILLLGSELILMFKKSDTNDCNRSLLGIIACVISTLLGSLTFFGQCYYNYKLSGIFTPFPRVVSKCYEPK
jgi:uncharacterized membrane protein